ncbi:hypothetical protein AXF42_Ash019594 [Apostasia shenzhenica]|uniref:Uncharacterized protein n=1 Tax=Apostasia shenzhenica TaxID=1088818 RepID=A0A2I0AV68_9ASPA|nr:hypothetical protein AXF42_Ash019594 [Apostasia shenzhenica]
MEERSSALPQTNDKQEAKPLIPEGEKAAAAPAPQDVKKRKIDDDGFYSTKYFKIRSIINDLRPFFVEVLQTPNFRESKAAHEIQTRLKTMEDLTKQLRNETGSALNSHETCLEQPLSGSVKEEVVENQCDGEKKPMKLQQELKKEELVELVNVIEKEFPDPFLVGGSPIGWNFLVYPGGKPIYYGLSKESTLAIRAAKKAGSSLQRDDT